MGSVTDQCSDVIWLLVCYYFCKYISKEMGACPQSWIFYLLDLFALLEIFFFPHKDRMKAAVPTSKTSRTTGTSPVGVRVGSWSFCISSCANVWISPLILKPISKAQYAVWCSSPLYGFENSPFPYYKVVKRLTTVFSPPSAPDLYHNKGITSLPLKSFFNVRLISTSGLLNRTTGKKWV